MRELEQMPPVPAAKQVSSPTGKRRGRPAIVLSSEFPLPLTPTVGDHAQPRECARVAADLTLVPGESRGTLIDALEDEEELVRRCADHLLLVLTGQDFGFSPARRRDAHATSRRCGRGARGGRNRHARSELPMRSIRCAIVLCFAPVLTLFGACTGPRFEPVDPEDRDRTECCTGTIARLDVAEDGTFAIELVPNEAGKRWLAPGQRTLVCEMMQPDRARNFEDLLAELRVGSQVEVCGYWIKDAERPRTYLFRTVTSIDRFPE